MASGPHTFTTGVVFSAEKFQGNPLAIVSVRGDTLTQQRKQLIAREFGYSETAFLHDAPGPGQPRRMEMFTPKEEVPFAGHAVIGAAHFIFAFCERLPLGGPSDRDTHLQQSAVVMTKAGPIPIFYNPHRQISACSVPHDFHIHKAQIPLDAVTAVQPQTHIVPAIEKIKSRTFPIVSIVKGMTFGLVDLTDAPEVLSALKVGEGPEMQLDEEWRTGFKGCLYYKRKEAIERAGEPAINRVHARMIEGGVEDPGTGSACCGLACYLALTDRVMQAAGKQSGRASDSDVDSTLSAKTENLTLGVTMEHHVFAVEQGIEMGRRCQIAVEVDIRREASGKREIASVLLSGRGNFMTEGRLLGEV